jgi:hypothetical protein
MKKLLMVIMIVFTAFIANAQVRAKVVIGGHNHHPYHHRTYHRVYTRTHTYYRPHRRRRSHVVVEGRL